MPGRPFQSKLVPHTDFIRECRARGITYPGIARALREQFGMRVAPSSVFSFVKVRARRRVAYSLPAPAAALPLRTNPRLANKTVSESGRWLGYDPDKPLEKQP